MRLWKWTRRLTASRDRRRAADGRAYNALMRLALTILLLAALPAHAAGPVAPSTCTPVVRNAWVRMPPGMPMGAGFFVIENPCREPVVLTSVRSDRFADVSMHETRVDGGIARMVPTPQVRVDPRRRVAFAPGGRHLMLMAPRGEVTIGAAVRIQLVFADGRRMKFDAPVRAAAP